MMKVLYLSGIKTNEMKNFLLNIILSAQEKQTIASALRTQDTYLPGEISINDGKWKGKYINELNNVQQLMYFTFVGIKCKIAMRGVKHEC